MKNKAASLINHILDVLFTRDHGYFSGAPFKQVTPTNDRELEHVRSLSDF